MVTGSVQLVSRASLKLAGVLTVYTIAHFCFHSPAVTARMGMQSHGVSPVSIQCHESGSAHLMGQVCLNDSSKNTAGMMMLQPPTPEPLSHTQVTAGMMIQQGS